MRKLLSHLTPAVALGALAFIAVCLLVYALGTNLGGDAGYLFVAVMGLLIGRSAGKFVLPRLDAFLGRR